MSLDLSKCHIIGNHVSRLNYEYKRTQQENKFTVIVFKSICMDFSGYVLCRKYLDKQETKMNGICLI